MIDTRARRYLGTQPCQISQGCPGPPRYTGVSSVETVRVRPMCCALGAPANLLTKHQPTSQGPLGFTSVVPGGATGTTRLRTLRNFVECPSPPGPSPSHSTCLTLQLQVRAHDSGYFVLKSTGAVGSDNALRLKPPPAALLFSAALLAKLFFAHAFCPLSLVFLHSLISRIFTHRHTRPLGLSSHPILPTWKATIAALHKLPPCAKPSILPHLDRRFRRIRSSIYDSSSPTLHNI